MANIDLPQGQNVPRTMKTRYKDVGGGINALLVAADMQLGGADIDADNPVNVAIQLDNTSSIDAFGRLRVSEHETLFEGLMQYNESPLYWDSILTGGGTATHLPGQSSLRMRCTTASGDKVVRQSRQYIRYQPGKSHLIMLTGVMGAAKAGVRQRMGYYDDDNGVFLEQTIDGAYIVIRSSVTGTAVDTRIAQSDWNIDNFDGSGPSAMNLDLTKSQILTIDMEWLGVGRVRVGFARNGVFYYAHHFLNSNRTNVPYIGTANLPLRYELENTGEAASQTDMTQICGMVSSEGGRNEKTLEFAVGNGATLRTVSNSYLPLLSIRLSTTMPPGGSLTNREIVVPLSLNIYSEDAAAYYQILLNPTLTGASWADVNATHSGVQYDVSASSLTGGIPIAAGYVSSGRQSIGVVLDPVETDIALTLNAAGDTSDILTVACIRVGTTNTDMGAALLWKEAY